MNDLPNTKEKQLINAINFERLKLALDARRIRYGSIPDVCKTHTWNYTVPGVRFCDVCGIAEVTAKE